jgi:hypothetical protein
LKIRKSFSDIKISFRDAKCVASLLKFVQAFEKS